MIEFPIHLPDELRSIFCSYSFDTDGDAFPFSEDWKTLDVSFDPVGGQTKLSLSFIHKDGFNLSIDLRAEDFPDVPDSVSPLPNLSGIGYKLSMLVEREVFHRDPDEFEQSAVKITSRGIEEGIKKEELDGTLNEILGPDWQSKNSVSRLFEDGD